jgi:ligand-binding sensor domain-containing protein
VAIDPRNPRRLYVGSTRGIFASEDGGLTFHPMGEGLEGREVDTILIDPIRPDRLYAAGVGIGVYSWNARERRFTPLNDGLPRPQYFFPVTLDPREPAALYAGSDGGIFRLDLEE